MFLDELWLACRVERHVVGSDGNIGYRGVLNPQSELGHIVPGSLFLFRRAMSHLLCADLVWFCPERLDFCGLMLW